MKSMVIYKKVQCSNKLPLAWETGDWDGRRSDIVHIVMVDGTFDAGRIYHTEMDGSISDLWYDHDDNEIEFGSVDYWIESVEITDNKVRELLDKWDAYPPPIQNNTFLEGSFIELRKSHHVYRAYLTQAFIEFLKEL